MVLEGLELAALARDTVETFVRERRIPERPPVSSAMLSRRAGCFVSIKTREGELRGCIGTIEPAKPTLADELMANAISAASRDPRFPPVRERELAGLRYSVDILSQPEPARSEDLNPATYGVIVQEEEGDRRGLLLPDLEGIDTVDKQVAIAARKAGIEPGSPLKLFRFRVERFSEPA
jgi:AmmeMemoRadiSam system protein A